MIEQYIYTRVDGGSAQKDYGHGLAATTEGIVGELKSDVSTIARYSNTTVDGEGRRVKVFEKRNLGTGNFAAFQQSVRFAERSAAGDLEDGDERLLYYSSTNRPQFLSHGYVCDIYDEAGTMLDPDRWFALKFVDYNTNLKEPELAATECLPPAATPLEPLPEVLEKAGLPLESFVTAVRACFDTENQDTIELIELDFTRPDAQELGGQILRWIFHFLPFAMRRQADFSSCYDTGCGGHEFAIAMIPSAMLIKERNGRISFKSMPSSAKYGYIFADGRVMHQKLSGRVDFDTSGSLYAAWLEQVIRRVYELPTDRGLELLRTLDKIYSTFDGLIRALPGKEQCGTELYDALCFAYLRTGFYRGEHIPEADREVMDKAAPVADFVETLLSFEDADTLRPLVPDILDLICEDAARGYDERLVKLLCLLRTKLADGPEVREVLDIWLARLIDSSDSATLREALDGYFAVTGEGERIPALERVFFPQVGTPRRWEIAGISWDKEAGEARARLWINGVVTEKDRWSAYLEQTKQVFETLATFAPANLAALVDRQLIPPMDAPSGDFSDMGALILCEDSLLRAFSGNAPVREKIEGFYDLIYDQLMRLCVNKIDDLGREPQKVIACLGQIRAAFKDAAGIEKGRFYLRELLNEALNEWLNATKEQINGQQKEKPTYLEDEPELHRHMAAELVYAYKAGADQELIRSAYMLTCWFLCKDSFSYRTREWYLNEIDGVMWFRNKLNATIVGTPTIAAVAEYLNSARMDYPTFLSVCGEFGQERESESLQVLKLLLELYDNGELPELESELLVYYAVCRDRRAAPEQRGRAFIRCFERVLEQKGGRGLIKLLNDFPNAEEQIEEDPKEEETGRFNIGKLMDFSKKLSKRSEPEEPEEYVRRDGLYPWMQTDEELLRSLAEAVRGCRDLLQDEMKEDEMLCPDLVTAVLDLAPADSTLIRSGRVVNTLLSDYWEEIRTGGTPAKKAMNELKKKGAFNTGR